MRLLFVDNRPEYFASHRLELANAARERGFDVHITALTRGDATPIRDAALRFHTVSDRKRTSNPLREALLLARLAALIRELDPDILHLITLRTILYGGIANRVAGVPRVVQSVTGLGFLYASEKKTTRVLRAFVEMGLKPAMAHPRRRVTFQNADDRALFREKGLIGENEGVVIPGSGVDPHVFRPQQCPRGEPPLVICPTRILWHKGVEDFVEAARLLLEEGTDARFAIVGDSDPDNPSAVPPRQIERWTETDGIEWWGYRNDMPDVFRRCSAVCFPSRYREGVPKVLLEAAASGRPSVTTDMPGCRDAVEDGVTGFVVAPGRPEAIAEALRRVLRDDQCRAQMGSLARKLALRRFTIGEIVDRTLREYDTIISRSPVCQGG